jgi:hypothetical protein
VRWRKYSPPIKEIFKPTIAAHPEAIGVDHPSQYKRGMGKGIPESLEDSPDNMTTAVGVILNKF